MYDLLIIGSGAAGLAAGIYAGRYKLKTLVIEGEFGGATAKAGIIANYPGVKQIDGFDLMIIMKEQVKAENIEIKKGLVESIVHDGHCFTAKIDEEEIGAKTIIFAGGAEHRKLGLPNEEELTGRGVHYCMTCDGPVYTGKTIMIVGGGDASVKSAILATQYVEKVYLISREKELHAEPTNMTKMNEVGDKIEVYLETEVKEIIGKDKLEKLILTKEINGSNEIIVDGLFVDIGVIPNVELAKSLGVELDEHGYIQVDSMMKTNVDGFFAAGDTVNHFGAFKQDITAAAMGTVAATSAYEDNKIHGNLCQLHQVPEKAK